jgi:pimeloyl-ACP methyl ester carboxylesterase
VTGGRCDEARPDLAILADRISDNEMVIFEDSSHLASIEERELYLRTIDEFLARVEADGD